jgi:1,4-dihydroxy-2-naphthoate octaprenyltransferase
LTFVTPTVGLLIQGGNFTYDFWKTLLPLFIVNASRMIVMNIPDRLGDEQGGKQTSVVLLGEEKAILLNNILYLATYLVVIPQCDLPFLVSMSYFVPLPLRWWQSLRLNSTAWWTDRAMTDSIPFVESLYVLATVTSLCGGLLAHFGLP